MRFQLHIEIVYIIRRAKYPISVTVIVSYSQVGTVQEVHPRWFIIKLINQSVWLCIGMGVGQVI